LVSESKHPELEVRTPQTRGEWWFYFCFLIAILAFFVAAILEDFTLAKLTAVFFVAFWVPLLALHELGHMLVAKAVGWHAEQLVVGVGPAAGRFRLGQTHVEARWFPVEGFVRCMPRNLRWPRVKSALIYFAGPGIELVLVALVVIAFGQERLLHPPRDVLTAAFQGLCLAAATGAVVNLIPHHAMTAEGEVPNDGMGILQSFFLRDEYFAELARHAYNGESEAWEKGNAEVGGMRE
jgi:hypothetical protein